MRNVMLQRSRKGVPPEEEGVREVSREPGSRPGEPEQGTHRGAENTQGTLLQEGEDGDVVLQGISSKAQCRCLGVLTPVPSQ